jgi:hypothetical protein
MERWTQDSQIETLSGLEQLPTAFGAFPSRSRAPAGGWARVVAVYED